MNKEIRIEEELKKLDTYMVECNRNDRVDAQIAVCIQNGVTDGRAIRNLIEGQGFDRIHVRIRLEKGAGPDPKRDRWRKSGEDQYGELPGSVMFTL